MADVPNYIAWKTGEPDFYQIYRYERDVDEDTARYVRHTPTRIFKTKRACDEAIRRELMQ